MAAVFALQACAQDPTVEPTPDGTGDESPAASPTATALGQECFSPDGGYRIAFPQDWHVNDPEGIDPCAWFHPEEFTLPVATEVTDVAIHVSIADSDFSDISEGITGGREVKEVLSEEQVDIGGRDALRAETVDSGEALFPEDTRQTIYAVDWDGRTLLASTTDLADGDYDSHVEVLDRMVMSLDGYEGVACSAAVLDPEMPEQDGLPDAVARMRADIAEAAVACDLERLAELAEGGDGFSFSFGGAEDPAEYWREQENDERALDPMRYLVGLLKRPYATREVQDTTYYSWPAAFTYDSWDEVPDEQKEALKPLYTEEDFSNWERFGGYIGYRATIDTSGDWLSYVAGD